MLDIYEFDSGKEGKHLLALGAIHGDEVCGAIALQEIIQQLEEGNIRLHTGKITIVPICNPQAYNKNTRFIDENLNRRVFPVKEPVTYEDHLKNYLCPLLEQADVVLDLHSYTAGGDAFAIVDYTRAEEVTFSSHLGVNHIVCGIEKAYQLDAEDKEHAKIEAMHTVEYTRMSGGYGVTLECGQHKDPESVVIAKSAVINALKFLNIIDEEKRIPNIPMITEMHKVIYAEDGCELFEEWGNFQLVSTGQKIAKYKDGRVISAQTETVILLPRNNTPVGEEWFYLGRVIN